MTRALQLVPNRRGWWWRLEPGILGAEWEPCWVYEDDGRLAWQSLSAGHGGIVADGDEWGGRAVPPGGWTA